MDRNKGHFVPVPLSPAAEVRVPHSPLRVPRLFVCPFFPRPESSCIRIRDRQIISLAASRSALICLSLFAPPRVIAFTFPPLRPLGEATPFNPPEAVAERCLDPRAGWSVSVRDLHSRSGALRLVFQTQPRSGGAGGPRLCPTGPAADANENGFVLGAKEPNKTGKNRRPAHFA
jgi:hypothetical protein